MVPVTSGPNAAISALWVAICILLALFIGVAAGILAWLAGQDPPAAILTGGGAFGGSLALALMIKKALK